MLRCTAVRRECCGTVEWIAYESKTKGVSMRVDSSAGPRVYSGVAKG